MIQYSTRIRQSANHLKMSYTESPSLHIPPTDGTVPPAPLPLLLHDGTHIHIANTTTKCIIDFCRIAHSLDSFSTLKPNSRPTLYSDLAACFSSYPYPRAPQTPPLCKRHFRTLLTSTFLLQHLRRYSRCRQDNCVVPPICRELQSTLFPREAGQSHHSLQRNHSVVAISHHHPTIHPSICQNTSHQSATKTFPT